jgi:hypothetical protein
MHRRVSIQHHINEVTYPTEVSENPIEVLGKISNSPLDPTLLAFDIKFIRRIQPIERDNRGRRELLHDVLSERGLLFKLDTFSPRTDNIRDGTYHSFSADI